MGDLRHLSCFTGIGGFDRAADAVGMTTVGQVEIDKQCRHVLRRHWPDIERIDDIRRLRARLEKRNAGRCRPAPTGIDVLSAGFPCQDVSIAGRRAGLAGARTGLWWELRRCIALLRLRWLVLENVPGLLSSNGGRDMGTILGSLADIGYRWAYRILDAQWHGVAQRRRRVFIVGYLGDERRPELPATVLFEPESLRGDPPPRREAGQGVARAVTSSPGGASCKEQQLTFVGSDGQPLNALSVSLRGRDGGGTAELGDEVGSDCTDTLVAQPQAFGGNNTRGPIEVATCLNAHGGPHGRQDFESETFIAEPMAVRTANFGANGLGVSEGIAHTVDDAPRQAICFKPSHYTRAKDGALRTNGCRPTNVTCTGYQVRRLTPREAERLQGFPDDWTAWGVDEAGQRVDLADGPRYRMLGNSVAVPCVEWILRRIVAAEAGHE